MTPEQLHLVSRSAAAVFDDPRPFAESFYGHLFTIAPDARPLFADNMEEQYGKIVDELAFLAGAADDLAVFVAHARDLGQRHAAYGVVEAHYELVEQALLESLAESLGDSWTTAHDAAWRALYRLIAEVMLDGASSTLLA